ncbi:MAG: nitroreductase family protein [Candidatus Aminicenantes bacterium]|jgi:nitroreductase/ketosteroid isomerase-like protein
MIKKYRILIFFVVLAVILPPPAAGEENRPGLSLEQTFWIYVRSIHNSDLESLFTTVTEGEDFYFLTSRGQLIDSRERYYKFHQDWFKEENWEMPVELLQVHEGQDYGYTLAKFLFKGQTPEGGQSVLNSYFTLIFRKENGLWKVVGDACTPIKRYTSGEEPGIEYSPEQTYLMNTIKNRRTVRKFKSTPVPEEHILKILDAAHYAPTAGNQQPWKFLVVQNREKLDRLQEEARLWYLEKYRQKQKPSDEELEKTRSALKDVLSNVLSAPVYIAVLVDSQSTYKNYALYDGILAAGYMMIAARALGYGTGFFTTFFPEGPMKKFFNIPDRYKLICFSPVGIPHEWPERPAKKKLEDLIVFESFHQR